MSRVAIVGGGPVGLVAAIRARLSGFDAVVLDKGSPPLDKACGEGIMPRGVEILRELEVEIDPGGAAPFCGVRYFDGDLVAEGRFPEGAGLGVRRTALHAALVQRAAQLGADLRWRTEVVSLSDRGVETDRGSVEARWILGADGLHSRVRSWCGLGRGPAPRKRFGVRRHYAIEPWTEFVEVHWADGAEAYVTPAGPKRVGVAMLWSGDGEGFEDLLGRFPSLAERLDFAPLDSKDLGAGPLHQRVSSVHTERVALIGDAAGYLDAITGEGLALGFLQAQAAVAAAQADDLLAYGRAHRKLTRQPMAMMRFLLWVEEHPAMRRRLIYALARQPGLFSRMLAVNDGQAPLSSVGFPAFMGLLGSAVRGPAGSRSD